METTHRGLLDLTLGIVDATWLPINISFTFVVSASLHDVAFFMHVMKNSIGRVTAGVNGVAFFAAAVSQTSANTLFGSAFVGAIFYFNHCYPLIHLPMHPDAGWVADCRGWLRHASLVHPSARFHARHQDR